MSVDAAIIQRVFNRDRVLEFEGEIEELLRSLVVIKAELEEVHAHRKEWLSNISHSHHTSSDVFREKIALMKAQGELTTLNLRLDVVRLDGLQDLQTLNMLIEATRPLTDEETEVDREMAMKSFARQNTEELREAMQASIAYRQQLTTFIRSLDTSLQGLQLQTEQERQLQEDEWRSEVSTFQRNMLESMKKSKSSYQSIVKEYLILRHNANVAQEILTRSQYEASQARLALQQCLEHITAEAAGHRVRIEQATNVELKTLTTDLRGQVVERERILEELQKTVHRAKKLHVQDQDELFLEIRKAEQRYVDLEARRIEDVKASMHEIAYLRDHVKSLQEKIAAETSRRHAWLERQEEEETWETRRLHPDSLILFGKPRKTKAIRKKSATNNRKTRPESPMALKERENREMLMQSLESLQRKAQQSGR